MGGMAAIAGNPPADPAFRQMGKATAVGAMTAAGADPGATHSDAGGTPEVWLEVDNNHETGEVYVEVWSRVLPRAPAQDPAKLFEGKLTGFRWDGGDAVIELEKVRECD